jgi:hypothetical protein
MAWERYYLPFLGDVVHQPGELQIDGTYMTCDGESLSVILSQETEKWHLVIHEVKLTWKSARTVADIAKQLMWMWQIKSYCKAKGTRFAQLHVYFVCGDYTYPMRPVLKKWLLEFTQEELDNNWKMLMEYKAYRTEKDKE